MEDPLPDDVLLDVLTRLRVDVPALFRCAMACKRWCGHIVDPSFLRRCWPEDACPSFVGFFNKQRLRDQGARTLIPTPHSELGSGRRRTIASFVLPGSAHLLYRAVPLASRCGLVLVHLVPHGREQRECPTAHLAVCNLVTGTCTVLPPLDCSTLGSCHYETSACAVLTSADCPPGEDDDDDDEPRNPSLFFKVEVISASSNNNGLKLDLHTFLFDEAYWRWSTRTNMYFDGPRDARGYGSFCQSDALVCRGSAHWLFDIGCFYVVSLTLTSDDYHRISFTRLPFVDQPGPCLSLTSDGMLSVLRMQNACSQLQIWTQQEGQLSLDGAPEWLCTRTIQLWQPQKLNLGSRPMILGEKRGTLLFNAGRQSCSVYTADLETGTIEEVPDWPRPFCIPDAVPLEMDWPMFFISRLATARNFTLPLPSPCGTEDPKRRRRRARDGRQMRRLQQRG